MDDLTIPDEQNANESDAEHSEQTEQTEQTEQSAQAVQADHTRMRMVQLAEAGEISQSVKYIKKASDRVISKLHAEYLMIEQDKNNAILSDVLITKFSELMGMLQTVPSGELLAAELREDKLLQGDIKKAVSFISPFIPFIGAITGGATLGKHMMRQRNETFEEP